LAVGSSVNLTEYESGGAWSCHDCNGIVVLNEQSGTITGIAPGRATVTYTITNDNATYLSITTVIVSPTPEFINQNNKRMAIAIIPNPNRGEFTIEGYLNSSASEPVSIEIVNMLGQIVYSGKISSSNVNLDEHVILNNSLANGVYLLNVHSAMENYLIHFVMER
jgi:hypothetical protein